MLVEWNESLILGIPAIDKQHRELYKMMDDLREVKNTHRKQAVAASILNRILPLIREHFAEEERTLGTDSPEYPHCVIKHREELEMVKFYLRGKSADDPSAVIDLLYFLDSMLDGHVEWDRKALGIVEKVRIQ